MRKVYCLAAAGQYSTPQQTFWDTGREISPVHLAEAIALQHSASFLNDSAEASAQLIAKVSNLSIQALAGANVYLFRGEKFGITETGRILVDNPYFWELEDGEQIGGLQ